MASIIPPYAEYIKVIARAGEAFNRHAFSELGLGAGHADYIRTICRNAGITQEELTRHIGIDKSNVARTLVILEKNGYVERRQSEEDKRVMLVYPTEKAYEVLPRVREVVRSWNSFLTEDFTPEEMEQFNSMLERITRKATEAVNKELGED